MAEHFELKGKQIRLRPIVQADIADYERWNDPTLKAFLFDGPWYRKSNLSKLIEHRKRKLAQDINPPYRSLEIDIIKGKHIGWVNAYHNDNDPHATAIGISIKADEHWGKGIGTEALALWINYLFTEMNLTRIGLTTWQGNPMMLRVSEKLGFIEEARIRRSCFVKGQFYDRISMGILREEWESNRCEFPYLEQT